MTLQLDRCTSADDFLSSAGSFLVAREAANNLLLGIASTLHDHPEVLVDAPRFAVVRDERGRPVAASLRTPPWNAVVSEVDDLAAVDVLVDGLLADGEELPGITAPRDVARRFAERWSAASGKTVRLAMAERIFEADAVVAPRPAPGRMRPAEERDRQLLKDWYAAFIAEASPETPPEDLDAVADRWLAGIGRRVFLWEDGADVVSLTGVGGDTPNGTRVGPVYTPPERRGRGYASNLVAAVTQTALDSGKRFCCLFTDLANPTSNHIYQAIGYRPVTDVDMYRFDDAT